MGHMCFINHHYEELGSKRFWIQKANPPTLTYFNKEFICWKATAQKVSLGLSRMQRCFKTAAVDN